MTDRIGVVVIGRNEGERLVRCLASLGPRIARCVYVDSGSTDGSVERATGLGAQVVRLDMTRPFTAARARNEGFGALAERFPDLRFVQFVDGDCELAPGWIDTAAAFLERDKRVAVVCGRRRERHPDASPYNRLMDLEWDTPVGEAAACGGDALMRTAAFVRVGGYRPELVAGEEPDLCARLRGQGFTVWRLDAEMTLHDAAMTEFRQWWLRAVRGGYGYAQVTHLGGHGLYRRELVRALVWGGAVPLAIALGALVSPWALAGVLAYPLQVARVARGHGWTYATFVVLAKFPECVGALKYHWGRLRGRHSKPADYKTAA